jgi:hypothetical protein
MLNSRGEFIPEEVIPKNSKSAGLDATTRKMLFPNDARSTLGIISRGKNVYKGGLPSPTNPGMDSKTGKVNRQQPSAMQKLAAMRLQGLI